MDDATLCRIGILPHLRGVKARGENLDAFCPFHRDEKKQSLSVNKNTGLWFCHAGCGKGNAVQFYARIKNLSVSEAFKELASLANGNGAQRHDNTGKKRIVATYDYTDETGKLLFQSVRYEPKDFRQRRPDGKGGWVWNLKNTRRVLYRLLELLKADPGEIIFLPEGEKDVERLQALVLVATCNPGGAGKWRGEYNNFLIGKDVVILPDADEAGEKHAQQVARSLLPVAKSIKVVSLPGLPAKGDVTDWLDAGRTKEELLRIVAETPLFKVEPAKQSELIGLPLTRLGDLLNEPEEMVSWLVENLLPSSGFSLLAGKPKGGKSTLARNLALCVARGEEFLSRNTERGAVIYLALEEKRSEVRKHFQAMGATGEEEIFIFAASAPEDAIAMLFDIAEEKKPGLIIIDPLFRLARVKDSNDYAQTTKALEPILSLARLTGAHVLCVHHTNKGMANDGDSILGSTAIFASVDTVVLLKRSERYRTVSSIQRYGEDMGETVLNFNTETRTISLGESKEGEEISRMKDAISEFMRLQERPLQEKEIKEGVEGNNRHKQNALRELVSEGRVSRDGKGTRGEPYTYLLSHSSYIWKSESENPKPGVSASETSNNSHFDTPEPLESGEVGIQDELWEEV